MTPTGYLIAVLFVYFLPTFITVRGRRMSVFVLNLFLGWTMIGWVVALFLGVKSHETGKAGV